MCVMTARLGNLCGGCEAECGCRWDAIDPDGRLDECGFMSWIKMNKQGQVPEVTTPHYTIIPSITTSSLPSVCRVPCAVCCMLCTVCRVLYAVYCMPCAVCS